MPEKKMMCHETGFKKQCVKENCFKWITIKGQNPATGEQVNESTCADAWLPLLIASNERAIHAVQDSVEQLRKEVGAAVKMAVESEKVRVVALKAGIETVKAVAQEIKTQNAVIDRLQLVSGQKTVEVS